MQKNIRDRSVRSLDRLMLKMQQLNQQARASMNLDVNLFSRWIAAQNTATDDRDLQYSDALFARLQTERKETLTQIHNARYNLDMDRLPNHQIEGHGQDHPAANDLTLLCRATGSRHT